MGDIPVYVISLRDSEVRRRNMTERLGALGILSWFVDAIDGRTQRLPDVYDGERVARSGRMRASTCRTIVVATAAVWLASVDFAHALCEVSSWGFRLAGQDSSGTMTVGSNEPCSVAIAEAIGKTIVHSVTLESGPVNGTAEMDPKSGIVYRSRAAYRGADSLTFLINGHGASCDCEGTARVTFAITVR